MTVSVRSQKELAEVFSCPVSTVIYWAKEGMPGTKGKYVVRDVITWLRTRPNYRGEWDQGEGKGDPDLFASDKSSPALERFREERAQLARLDRLEREKQLIPRDHVRDGLGRIASVLRTAGDLLRRRFGNDAVAVLEDALDDAAAEVARLVEVGQE